MTLIAQRTFFNWKVGKAIFLSLQINVASLKQLTKATNSKLIIDLHYFNLWLPTFSLNLLYGKIKSEYILSGYISLKIITFSTFRYIHIQIQT